MNRADDSYHGLRRVNLLQALEVVRGRPVSALECK